MLLKVSESGRNAMALPEKQVYSIRTGFVYLHNSILVPFCIWYGQKPHALSVGPVVRGILMAMMYWFMDIQCH
jgi:hypothetical protein